MGRSALVIVATPVVIAASVTAVITAVLTTRTSPGLLLFSC